MRSLLLAFLLAVAYCNAALAGAVQDCNQRQDDDLRIRGCSLIIEGQAKGSKAVAYFNRGWSYNGKGEHKRAVEDYTHAIELNPSNAEAYNNRGWAYNNNHEYDKAILDLNRAIELNPKHYYAYNNRGIAYTSKGEHDRAIADFSRAIDLNPKYAEAYATRSVALAARGEYDRSIADLNQALELSPKSFSTYAIRAGLHTLRGDYDRSIADLKRALELNPAFAAAYNLRGTTYALKGDYDRAIADFNRAIELAPKAADVYNGRGFCYSKKGEYGRAIADFDQALSLDPNFAPSYLNRGTVYRQTNKIEEAFADVSRALQLKANDLESLVERGHIHEAKGMTGLAIADYRDALSRPGREPLQREAHEEAQRRLAALTTPANPTQAPATATEPPASGAAGAPGRRVALVIANSNYAAVGRLANPANDARIIAAALRHIGFSEVIERYDLDLSGMSQAIKEFGDTTADADWGVVYYAGHGIEVGGVSYLVPTDAKLLRDSHVIDEALPLDRVLAKVESAKKLRLVILDACRNNPFAARMVRSAGSTRSVGRGLAPLEPEGGVLVAYSAKHGTLAQDGDGANSPFATALAVYLEERGLEIQFLFRKVRDRVLSETGGVQEPFLYGSLGAEPLYFANKP